MRVVENGLAELDNMDGHYVMFRYGIDDTEPETVFIKITRERWTKLNKPTELYLELTI